MQLLLRHRVRRFLAIFAVAAFTALAVGATIYLATPRDPGARWHNRTASRPPVKTTAVTNEPGSVDLQIAKKKDARTFRFRKVGEDWVIQDVTPKAPPRRLFPWSRPQKPARPENSGS